MDNKIIELFKAGENQNDIVLIKEYIVINIEDIGNLQEKDLIFEIHNNKGELVFIDNINNGDIVDISLLTYKLVSLGYYYDFNEFVLHNQVDTPDDFYIREIDFQHNITKEIPTKLNNYFSAITLIKSLIQLSSHSKNDSGVETLYIVREKSDLLVLPINFLAENIDKNDVSRDIVLDISQTLNGMNDEKRILYINELVIFLNDIENEAKFKYLLKNLSLFYSKCLNSFEYYLRNFTYNKFKIELDSAILNYTQKIRTVINEAQNKLIAIPAAFVLACATLDFSNILTIKNFVTLSSLFIFSLLIEIFIRNQLSSLIMIKTDIEGYKNTFNSRINLNSEVTLSFNKIDNELEIQRSRIEIIRIITWGIPISLTIICLFLFLNTHISEATSGSQLICWYNIIKKCL